MHGMPRAGRWSVGWLSDGVLDLLQDMYQAAPQAGSWAFYWLSLSATLTPCQEVFAKEQMFLSFIHLFIQSPIHPSIIHSFFHVSIHPWIRPSTHSFVHPFIYSSNHLLSRLL